MEKKIPASSQKKVKELSMAEQMDQSIAAWQGTVNGAVLCRIIREIFNIDLDKAPVLDEEVNHRIACSPKPIASISAAAIDYWMEQQESKMSGPEIRILLNQLFGTNLEGISILHEQRISLYSKGQWMAKNSTDLFSVHTGPNDVDAKVIPTPYFTEKTGLMELPKDLQDALSRLGYICDNQVGAYYFLNPDGRAVPDQFKHQTITAIHETIQKLYADL